MTPHPISNEALLQLIIQWIQSAARLQDTRHFLETRMELLDPRTITLLDTLVTQQQGDVQAEEQIHTLQSLVQDAISHGATTTAVCNAYVNLFGGFQYEIPMWLTNDIAAINAFQLEEGSDVDLALARDTLWEATYEHAIQDAQMPSTLAAIATQAARTWKNIHGVQHSQAQERRIVWYLRTLTVLTETNYPRLWAAAQNNLGELYRERIASEKVENQERAIACYERALHVYTEAHLPRQWAIVQNNLGAVYLERLEGVKAENQERAIAHFTNALRIRTEDRFPLDWGMTLNNLGTVYRTRLHGKRAENQEQSLLCYANALRAFTEEQHPLLWAGMHTNLGTVYHQRIRGIKSANIEQAIAHHTAALQVYTEDTLPLEWAVSQTNLGNAYADCRQGQVQENQEQAITCYMNALRVRTVSGLPALHRMTARILAAYFAGLGRWEEAQAMYASARHAETVLLALATTAHEQDMLLNDGHDAIVREAYVLTQLGNVNAAVQVLEIGRVRTLAATQAQLAAHPAHISDPQRRERYQAALNALKQVQRAAYARIDPRLDQHERRMRMLARYEAVSAAQAAYETCLHDIAEAQDPPNFLQLDISPDLWSNVFAQYPAQHALVYLLTTPWGGCALAVRSSPLAPEQDTTLLLLALPQLVEHTVKRLVEVVIDDDEQVIGGLGWTQLGLAFTRFRHFSWAGDTFALRAAELHATCQRVGQTGSFDQVAQDILGRADFQEVIDLPFDELERETPQQLKLLRGIFNHQVLLAEIKRAMTVLADIALQPIMHWLHAQNVMGVTLIPCGFLATFPLLAAPVAGELPITHAEYQAFADVFPNGVSVAPSARTLLRSGTITQRAGLRGIGNPAESGGTPLRWGQAEAMTLARLAGTPDAVRVGYGATRATVIEGLQHAKIFEASCHGNGGRGDFLDYGIFLARGEQFTLRDIFSGEVANLHGLRLFILSACQTSILDIRGAREEVRSLSAGLLQAGCEAVLAAQWSVDDYASYLLIIRFFQLWQQSGFDDSPARSLAHAQAWLRTVTWGELQNWQAIDPLPDVVHHMPDPDPTGKLTGSGNRTRDGETYLTQMGWFDDAVYSALRDMRYNDVQAQQLMRTHATEQNQDECPFADPFYWAAFSITGW